MGHKVHVYGAAQQIGQTSLLSGACSLDSNPSYSFVRAKLWDTFQHVHSKSAMSVKDGGRLFLSNTLQVLSGSSLIAFLG
jgi:hypothetical protein